MVWFPGKTCHGVRYPASPEPKRSLAKALRTPRKFITDGSGQLQYKYDFKLLEAITYLEFDLGPFPTRIILDYIVNTADGVPSGENSAYLAEIRIGNPEKRGDYSLGKPYYDQNRMHEDSIQTDFIFTF
ncbi:MAG: hypothetical protein V1689_06915 [Pseudomonadota bacterium]